MKENPNFYKLGEIEQSPVRVSLSHLASQQEAAFNEINPVKTED